MFQTIIFINHLLLNYTFSNDFLWICTLFRTTFTNYYLLTTQYSLLITHNSPLGLTCPPKHRRCEGGRLASCVLRLVPLSTSPYTFNLLPFTALINPFNLFNFSNFPLTHYALRLMPFILFSHYSQPITYYSIIQKPWRMIYPIGLMPLPCNFCITGKAMFSFASSTSHSDKLR